MDASVVPGVLFSNRPIALPNPSLVDLAPSILTEFGLTIPSTMTGRNIFKG
jgi:bisphosphoglycerate-independent phosphoglycerate mutase (AlkP superfamily)